MAVTMTANFLYALNFINHGVGYLWNPPHDSWVSVLASLFFHTSLFIASPVILLLALDFTSYAIVRTLGIEHAHPVSSKSNRLSPITPASIIVTGPSNPPSRKATSEMSIAIPPLSPGLHPDHLDLAEGYFATPGSANLELAGVGLFSPPESRTPSPPITRRSTRASLSSLGSIPIIDAPMQVPSTEADDEGSVMLRRRRAVNSSTGS